MFDSSGAPVTPWGGSCWRRRKSRINLLFAGVIAIASILRKNHCKAQKNKILSSYHHTIFSLHKFLYSVMHPIKHPFVSGSSGDSVKDYSYGQLEIPNPLFLGLYSAEGSFHCNFLQPCVCNTVLRNDSREPCWWSFYCPNQFTLKFFASGFNH